MKKTLIMLMGIVAAFSAREAGAVSSRTSTSSRQIPKPPANDWNTHSKQFQKVENIVYPLINANKLKVNKNNSMNSGYTFLTGATTNDKNNLKAAMQELISFCNTHSDTFIENGKTVKSGTCQVMREALANTKFGY